MSVENHETALSLEISHDIGNAVLRRKTYQHMDMVRAGLRFNDLDVYTRQILELLKNPETAALLKQLAKAL